MLEGSLCSEEGNDNVDTSVCGAGQFCVRGRCRAGYGIAGACSGGGSMGGRWLNVAGIHVDAASSRTSPPPRAPRSTVVGMCLERARGSDLYANLTLDIRSAGGVAKFCTKERDKASGDVDDENDGGLMNSMRGGLNDMENGEASKGSVPTASFLEVGKNVARLKRRVKSLPTHGRVPCVSWHLWRDTRVGDASKHGHWFDRCSFGNSAPSVVLKSWSAVVILQHGIPDVPTCVFTMYGKSVVMDKYGMHIGDLYVVVRLECKEYLCTPFF